MSLWGSCSDYVPEYTSGSLILDVQHPSQADASITAWDKFFSWQRAGTQEIKSNNINKVKTLLEQEVCHPIGQNQYYNYIQQLWNKEVITSCAEDVVFAEQ